MSLALLYSHINANCVTSTRKPLSQITKWENRYSKEKKEEEGEGKLAGKLICMPIEQIRAKTNEDATQEIFLLCHYLKTRNKWFSPSDFLRGEERGWWWWWWRTSMIPEFRMGEQLCDEMIMIAQVTQQEASNIALNSTLSPCNHHYHSRLFVFVCQHYLLPLLIRARSENQPVCSTCHDCGERNRQG